MSEKQVTVLPKVNPFLRMQAESLNWSGYDPGLLELAIARGLNLEEENKTLNAQLTEANSRGREKFLSDFGQAAGVVAAIGGLILAAILVVALMGKVLSKDAAVREAKESARKEVIVSTLTYAEAQNRKLPEDQVKIILTHPDDPALFADKEEWISRRVSSINSREKVEKEWNELRSEKLYKVFLKTP